MEEWAQSLIKKPVQGLEIMDWCEKELAHLSKKARRLKAALMIYVAWNIWKARNKRIFEQRTMSPGNMLQEIKAEMQCRFMACGNLEFSSFSV
ncbi:hypothetical protein PAHAL_2G364300 [Panicum hallii]|jgi:hypothetical protein|uniref:Uncharacterized protein n=1 Tax=Panicum hallii TaxID=206008 RepID=A0A2T8KRN9_9POAL|nr:hypothetical protein PAHAL_2G364300 [Panicum hallii]